jgi:uncharacterized protein Smg (DUF494 family)
MYYLIYISMAVRPMGQKDLVEILTQSRDRNLRKNITGLLLYAEGAIIQLLEGSREDVLETYYAINQDERHKNIIKLVNAPAEERAFSKWSMGFVTVAPERLKKLEAYINPDSELFD